MDRQPQASQGPAEVLPGAEGGSADAAGRPETAVGADRPDLSALNTQASPCRQSRHDLIVVEVLPARGNASMQQEAGSARRRPKTSRLYLERLEDRHLLSGINPL